MDWRTQVTKNAARLNQLTGANSQTGLFSAYIDTAGGENQSGKFVYAGGERSIPLPMPFESNTSWIRAIPENGTPAMCSYRNDTGDLVCINYYSFNPKNKLSGYTGSKNIYRTLKSGEIEINSSGMAQSYYSQRPVLEQRAGVCRTWIDQDRLEIGAKSPLHTKQIYEYKSNQIGDEERFGAVKRPYNFLFDPNTLQPRNPLTAILAESPYSRNYFDYPFPNFTLPTGFPSPSFAQVTATTANAAAAALIAIGEFKQRVFAKEYLKVLKNPLYPTAPNPILLDIREGQVFDDKGVQTIGPNGAYIRAKYDYYTPALDSTSFVIDEIGNVNWNLSLASKSGWNVLSPAGPIKMATSLQGMNFTSALAVEVLAGTSIGMTAGTDATFDVVSNMEATVGGNYSVNCIGSGSHQYNTGLEVKSNASTTINSAVDLNLIATSGNFKASAPIMDLSSSASFKLASPTIDITAAGALTLKAADLKISAATLGLGAAPAQSMVLGEVLVSCLNLIIQAISLPAVSTAPGSPVVPNAGLIPLITQIQALITTLTSKTIKVSP